MSSFLSEIFASPRDREDFVIALVVLGLFGAFIFNYALPDTPEEPQTAIFVSPDEVDVHLKKIEEGEVRPEPRRMIIDDDVEEIRQHNSFIPKETAAVVPAIATVDDMEVEVEEPSTAIETEIFDEAVEEPEEEEGDYTYIEEENPETPVYEEETIEEGEETPISEEEPAEATAAEAEKEAIVEEVQPELEAEPVVEEEEAATAPIPTEFNTKGNEDFDCLIIVGAFKVAENADVITAQLEQANYTYKKIQNRGFTCVGIPMACSDRAGIAETKAKMKTKFKVDPWVMKN